MWDEQFAVFTQRYRVIRYDTRGFGKSKTEDVEFNQIVQDFIHDVAWRKLT